MNYDPKLLCQIRVKFGNGFISKIVTSLDTVALICGYLDKDSLVYGYYVSWDGSANVIPPKSIGFSDHYPKWIESVEVAMKEFGKNGSDHRIQ